jgi:hypothetical protein
VRVKPGSIVLILSLVLWLFPGATRAGALNQEPNASDPPQDSFDATKLRDITGIEHTARPPTIGIWRMVGAVGLAIVAALALTAAWGIRRFQPRPMSVPSLIERTLEELDRFGKLVVSDQEAFSSYHSRLSDVIRRYLEEQFDIPATQRTTEEFFRVLPVEKLLAPGNRELLRQLLERCDVAKFSAAQLSAADCETARCLARRFVAPEDVRNN